MSLADWLDLAQWLVVFAFLLGAFASFVGGF